MAHGLESIPRVWRAAVLSFSGAPPVAEPTQFVFVQVQRIDDHELWDADVALLLGSDEALLDHVKQLRQAGFPNPVLVVQAWPEPSAAALLELGADDVVAHGVDPRELAARLKAVVRRGPQRWVGEENEFLVDESEQLIRIRDLAVRLSPLPFRLLRYLIQNRGRWVRRQEILENVFETHHDPTTSLVRFHVYTIRKALGSLRDCVREDRHGIRGYRFEPPACSDDGVAVEHDEPEASSRR